METNNKTVGKTTLSNLEDIYNTTCPEDYINRECTISDLPLEGNDQIVYLVISPLGEFPLPRQVTQHIPVTATVKVLSVYQDWIDTDEGYDDYYVYEVELLEKGGDK